MGSITDLLGCMLLLQYLLLRWSLWTILRGRPRRGGIHRCWTAIWETWLENKGFPGVSRKGLSQCINLLLHVWHRPCTCALLKYPHMTSEVFASIRIQIWVWRCECNLVLCSVMFTTTMRYLTYQVEDCTCQDTINGEVDTSLHTQKSSHAERLQYGFLYSA